MRGSALDPRVGAATVVAGPADMIGPVVRCDLVHLNGREILLPKAHPGVTDYISVANSESRANALFPQLSEGLDMTGRVAYQPDASLVFDFQAAGGTAVNSAVTGLEAFTNHHLARYCPPGQSVVYEGETYTLGDLRNMPLNERLGEVLPAFYGRPSPTQEGWWQPFRRVQGLAALIRHAVDEPVKRHGLSGQKSLAQRFCDGDYRGAAAMMLDAFAYFEPTWIDPERLALLPRPPTG